VRVRPLAGRRPSDFELTVPYFKGDYLASPSWSDYDAPTELFQMSVNNPSGALLNAWGLGDGYIWPYDDDPDCVGDITANFAIIDPDQPATGRPSPGGWCRTVRRTTCTTGWSPTGSTNLSTKTLSRFRTREGRNDRADLPFHPGPPSRRMRTAHALGRGPD
jgi:hypothetical protein